ncbi:hypothetical protein CROQUDRAFT_74757 [Cronartium quercuum f. sp. fusiforme G11]|uniref:2Fe-2S ferredoxin-type domain-containing protein n=1 Tax=Cronartium quercuum f. sp. fusiforme G11 TaxID=708437 RepID=A0A9P6NRS7_9BASI|nr:hypothetical protein CROQUDRAFT_74757 [Cronartium quercuum f. sp. fusiforme G11]
MLHYPYMTRFPRPRLLSRTLDRTRLYSTRSVDEECFSSRCTATVPLYTRHLILHDAFRAEPDWPSDLATVSPLYEKLSQLAKPGDILAGLGVSVSSTTTRNTILEHHPKPDIIQEAYIYSINQSLRLPFPLSSSNVDKFVEFYQSLPRLEVLRSLETYKLNRSQRLLLAQNCYHVYVCVHESRDCRCGKRGKPLLKELVRLYDQRAQGSGPVLRFHPISHVGGHKHAGNLLVYPSGHWYGLLDPTAGDAKTILEHLLSLGTPKEEIWWNRWRGQIGLDKDTQWAVYDSSLQALSKSTNFQQAPSRFESRKVIVRFKTFDGEVISLKGQIGEDIRSIAKRGQAPAIEATCGGNCECATCQVYLNINAPVPAPSENEEDMLFTAIDRRKESRLACQLILTNELADWLEKSLEPQLCLPRF